LKEQNRFERVEDGSASILYISPESLRSRTIEKLLLGRKIVRFVIDEAHCFSSWGQDFRVDYLYIGDFIKSFRKKNLEDGIPFLVLRQRQNKK
jgi:ATP-dependent DNA helicase RecQ